MKALSVLTKVPKDRNPQGWSRAWTIVCIDEDGPLQVSLYDDMIDALVKGMKNIDMNKTMVRFCNMK